MRQPQKLWRLGLSLQIKLALMKTYRAAGALLLLLSSVPLVTAFVFVFGFGAPPTESYVIEKIILGCLAFVSALFLFTRLAFRLQVSTLGWLAMVFLCAKGLYEWSEGYVAGLEIPAHVFIYAFCALAAAAGLAFVVKELMSSRRVAHAEG